MRLCSRNRNHRPAVKSEAVCVVWIKIGVFFSFFFSMLIYLFLSNGILTFTLPLWSGFYSNGAQPVDDIKIGMCKEEAITNKIIKHKTQM